jgi:hypothetical protein
MTKRMRPGYSVYQSRMEDFGAIVVKIGMDRPGYTYRLTMPKWLYNYVLGKPKGWKPGWGTFPHAFVSRENARLYARQEANRFAQAARKHDALKRQKVPQS